jgi:hypothetical protein
VSATFRQAATRLATRSRISNHFDEIKERNASWWVRDEFVTQVGVAAIMRAAPGHAPCRSIGRRIAAEPAAGNCDAARSWIRSPPDQTGPPK